MTASKAKLSEVAEIIAGQSPPSSSYNTDGNGLPFLQGKADFGKISPKIRIWCDAPQKTAEPGDILISVRAPVGPTNICDLKACIGRGLSAIRVSNKIKREYLFGYLRANESKIASLGKGSTFKAITQRDLQNLIVPIPSIEEQTQFVKLYEQSSELIEKRKQAIELLDKYLISTFLKMFGNPMSNPKNWDLKKFGAIGKLDRGMSKHRPRNAPELLGGDHPLIQTGDVSNSGIYIRTYKSTYSDIGLKQSKKWPIGTLCITIAANIAKTGILDFDACFPDSVVGFVPDVRQTNNLFIHYWISFLQEMLERNAPVSAQKNINLKILRDLDVFMPPIESQNKFAEIVKKTELIRQKMLIQSEELDNQFRALMQKAFN